MHWETPNLEHLNYAKRAGVIDKITVGRFWNDIKHIHDWGLDSARYLADNYLTDQKLLGVVSESELNSMVDALPRSHMAGQMREATILAVKGLLCGRLVLYFGGDGLRRPLPSL